MRIRDLPGCSYRYHGLPAVRLFFREDKEQRSKVYPSYALMIEDLTNGLYERISKQRAHKKASKALPVKRGLPDLIHAYAHQNNPTTKETKHTKRITRGFSRICSYCGWTMPSQIRSEQLKKYAEDPINAKRLGALNEEITRFLTFVRWLALNGQEIDKPVLTHPVPPYDEAEKRDSWTAQERQRWWAYLSRGMDILARADAHLSWYERVVQCCDTKEFQLRMLILPIWLLGERYLHRPCEIRRLTPERWDTVIRKLVLLVTMAKTKRKKISWIDREVAWLLTACCLGSDPKSTIFKTFTGKAWTEHYLWVQTKALLRKAGLGHRAPYDYKYNTITDLLNGVLKVTISEAGRNLAIAQVAAGHVLGSNQTQRYFDDKYGSPHALDLQAAYDAQRIFPFSIEDYPIAVRPSGTGT